MKQKEKYQKLIKGIIEDMQKIIGDVALTQAKLVKGLYINHKIIIKKEPKKTMEDLIKCYERLMGPVAVTISKRSIERISRKK